MLDTALVRLAIVLSLIVIVPDPRLLIPKTVCAFAVEAELALILFAVMVLPIVLLLILVVPVVPVLFIPTMLAAKVEAVAEEIEPIILFWQSTVPVVAILIP